MLSFRPRASGRSSLCLCSSETLGEFFSLLHAMIDPPKCSCSHVKRRMKDSNAVDPHAPSELTGDQIFCRDFTHYLDGSLGAKFC